VAVRCTRREAVRLVAVGAAAVCAPARAYQPRDGVSLRVLGTHATLQEPIRRRAEQELGITIEHTVLGGAEMIHRAISRPESFDVVMLGSHVVPLAWQAGAIRAIDCGRVAHWRRMNPLVLEGKLRGAGISGAGDTPNASLYVGDDGSLGDTKSARVSFVPCLHNVDSFAYRASAVRGGDESWGWLLDPAHAGRVALVNEPTIAVYEAALAAQALGLARFGDLGAITEDELDVLFEILIDYKVNGFFAGFWRSVPESVEYLRRERTAVQSAYAPAVWALRGMGEPVRLAAPREGYRGWVCGMSVSSGVGEAALGAAHRYIDWWHSGWAGGVMARQGFYVPASGLAREHLSASEWAFWYEGREATSVIRGVDGRVVARVGERRSGGSYEERFGRVAVWNTLTRHYEHVLERWGELLNA